ncbi:hypothetical protein [Gorillibacterium sp. CAU 1737]|uniref:hypothetical protein n=1 Tax=Gorillibacterium sp. CAU 1737 TaxID=3140362 RepID=UPI00325FF42D
MSDLSGTFVYWPSVRIIAHPSAKDDLKEVLVDINKLEWNEDDFPFLSLSEIGTQLEKMGYTHPFYVWSELGLSGRIYQYGNYDPPTWEHHGTTKGYA